MLSVPAGLPPMPEAAVTSVNVPSPLLWYRAFVPMLQMKRSGWPSLS